jgi:hypothetical protein
MFAPAFPLSFTGSARVNLYAPLRPRPASVWVRLRDDVAVQVAANEDKVYQIYHGG